MRWTPSKIISRLGKEINNEDSIYYWAHKNNIPVFCPAITDGSLGDMMYFHSYKRPEFVCDVVADIRAINDIAVRAPSTGMIILGGGVIKHHTCNANLMRNGAEFSVFINTGQVVSYMIIVFNRVFLYFKFFFPRILIHTRNLMVVILGRIPMRRSHGVK